MFRMMDNNTQALSEQLTLERFNQQQDRVVRDMGDGDTVGALRITEDYLTPFKQYIEGRFNAKLSVRDEEHTLLVVLRRLKPEVIAFSVMNSAFHSIGLQETWTDTVTTVGNAIKGEAWAAGLLVKDAKLHERIAKAASRRNGSLEYRKQAARVMARHAGYKGEQWSKRMVLIAGTILLRYLLAALPEVFVKESENPDYSQKTKEWLSITPNALEKAEAAVEQALRGKPVFLPMTTPPKPWTGYWNGGHWDERSRFKAPVVRTHYKQTQGAVRAALASGSMKPHVDALNTLQAVPWKINERVLGVLRWAWQNDIRIKGNKPGSWSFPPANDELPPPKTGEWATMSDDEKKLWRHQAALVKQRNRAYIGQRILMKHDMETADLMAAAGRFWCPVNCDWRGRIYAIPHFNFARDDRVRALFLFADGEPIGEEGLKWLKVHVANCGDFDKVSKKPLTERIKWTEENLDRIELLSSLPTKELWWTKADKPFLFLAACMELTSAVRTGPTYVTRLPVSFDGSCSGLQHLSAMTRDDRTARLVNLLPSVSPMDVYQTVADAVLTRVSSDLTIPANATLAELWLRYGVTRKVVKRNVMTYAYSSKKFGMAQQIMEDLMRPLSFDVLAGKRVTHPFGDDETAKAAAKYLAGIVFDTIETLVAKPAEAMKMLQKTARALAHEGKPVCWTTPLGLPWINRYHKPKLDKLDLWLHDARVQTRFADGHHEAKIDKDRAANGVAPNFVHACDACHLLMVANASASEGIAMATVHDSFGCLASRAGRYRNIIREQFVKLYEDNDVLHQVWSQANNDLTVHNQQRLPFAPGLGELNLKEVLNAEYAFA